MQIPDLFALEFDLLEQANDLCIFLELVDIEIFRDLLKLPHQAKLTADVLKGAFNSSMEIDLSILEKGYIFL